MSSSLVARRLVVAGLLAALLASVLLVTATPAGASGPGHQCGDGSFGLPVWSDDGALTDPLHHALEGPLPVISPTPQIETHGALCGVQQLVDQTACNLPLLAFLSGTMPYPCAP